MFSSTLDTITPYIKLSRLHVFPMGALLFFWPCAWSLTMASYHDPRPLDVYARVLLAYLAGATLVHSAGCTFNDLCDRKFDGEVERTKDRPMVTGEVTPRGAIIWTVAQLCIATAILRLANDLAFIVGFLGSIPLLSLYPFMKRWTHWPQAYLGLGMNWGIFISWLATTNSLKNVQIPIVLYFGSICWTIVYDTIYACQDRSDDVKIGIKSTALLFGDHVHTFLSIFASAFLVALTAAGILNQQGWVYYIIAVGGCAAHFLWQLCTLDTKDNKGCWDRFISNHTLGGIVWFGIALDLYVEPVRLQFFI